MGKMVTIIPRRISLLWPSPKLAERWIHSSGMTCRFPRWGGAHPPIRHQTALAFHPAVAAAAAAVAAVAVVRGSGATPMQPPRQLEDTPRRRRTRPTQRTATPAPMR